VRAFYYIAGNRYKIELFFRDVMIDSFEFSNEWFEQLARPVWQQLLDGLPGATCLEVGSYEGASACYLIQTLGHRPDFSLRCIDTWLGGSEHQPGAASATDMMAVEARFRRNLARAVTNTGREQLPIKVCKGRSDHHLADMLTRGMQNHFDFIYIDGSHEASDVLLDALLAFRLLKAGGLMVLDDYAWSNSDAASQRDLLRSPKLGIDAFTSVHFREIDLLPAPLYQLYLRKLASPQA